MSFPAPVIIEPYPSFNPEIIWQFKIDEMKELYGDTFEWRIARRVLKIIETLNEEGMKADESDFTIWFGPLQDRYNVAFCGLVPSRIDDYTQKSSKYEKLEAESLDLELMESHLKPAFRIVAGITIEYVSNWMAGRSIEDDEILGYGTKMVLVQLGLHEKVTPSK